MQCNTEHSHKNTSQAPDSAKALESIPVEQPPLHNGQLES